MMAEPAPPTNTDAVKAQNMAMYWVWRNSRLNTQMNTATPRIDRRISQRCCRGLKGLPRNGRITSWTRIVPQE